MSTAEAPTPIFVAPIFAALGDATRLSLLMRLSRGGSASIATLSVDTRITRQAVTKHLRVLESAGLVRSERAGRESRFAFRPDAVFTARGYLETVSTQWADALDRLRVLVED